MHQLQYAKKKCIKKHNQSYLTISGLQHTSISSINAIDLQIERSKIHDI